MKRPSRREPRTGARDAPIRDTRRGWITPTAKDCLSALRDLWDRGLGRPPQAIHIDLLDLPDAVDQENVLVPAEVDCDRIAEILQILDDANMLSPR